MIHWVINRVTSALGFQRSPISSSKTKLKHYAVMTSASWPVGSAVNSAYSQLKCIHWTAFIPSEHSRASTAIYRGHLTSQTKTNRLPFSRRIQPHRTPPTANSNSHSEQREPRNAHPNEHKTFCQWEKEESCRVCSEMIHLSLIIQLLRNSVFTVTDNDGIFFPDLC